MKTNGLIKYLQKINLKSTYFSDFSRLKNICIKKFFKQVKFIKLKLQIFCKTKQKGFFYITFVEILLNFIYQHITGTGEYMYVYNFN